MVSTLVVRRGRVGKGARAIEREDLGSWVVCSLVLGGGSGGREDGDGRVRDLCTLVCCRQGWQVEGVEHGVAARSVRMEDSW